MKNCPDATRLLSQSSAAASGRSALSPNVVVLQRLAACVCAGQGQPHLNWLMRSCRALTGSERRLGGRSHRGGFVQTHTACYSLRVCRCSQLLFEPTLRHHHRTVNRFMLTLVMWSSMTLQKKSGHRQIHENCSYRNLKNLPHQVWVNRQNQAWSWKKAEVCYNLDFILL